MKLRYVWVLMVVLMFGVGSCATHSGSRPSVEPAKPKEREWISLFNGHNLDGWNRAREPSAENLWFVEEGVMTNRQPATNTGTIDLWRDFELQLEYRLVPNGNSGVYLRGRIEVQVFDSFGKESVGEGDDGAIYGQTAPLVNASKPAGEWNKLEARYVGEMLTVSLNGRVVHDGLRITEPTGGALAGRVNDPGPLMLQGDHSKVWYRNIRIRPIEKAHH